MSNMLTMTMMTISRLCQHNQFLTRSANLSPELSQKLQLEHHQCVRLLKAVYGLVSAPRRWYQRVEKDLRNLRDEEYIMEPCLWTFREESGVMHALCLLYVDDFMLACYASPFGKHVFDSVNNLYEW